MQYTLCVAVDVEAM